MKLIDVFEQYMIDCENRGRSHSIDARQDHNNHSPVNSVKLARVKDSKSKIVRFKVFY